MYLSTAGPDALVPSASLPLWVGVVFGLLVSAAVGLVNGIVTTFLRVPSFVTTLGMLFFLNGINLNAIEGQQVITPGGTTFKDVMGGYPLYLNTEFFWAIALVLAVQFVLTYTRWGLHTVATGGNLIGAAESGVNVRAIKSGNFTRACTPPRLQSSYASRAISPVPPLQGGPDVMFLA